MEIPSWKLAGSPLATVTLDGMLERMGELLDEGLTLSLRSTVPEKPPMLETLMFDWALIPGFTHKIRGFALIAKSEFWALTSDTDTSSDDSITSEAQAVGSVFLIRLIPETVRLMFFSETRLVKIFN